MAFTRPKYDDCATKLHTNRLVEPGNYRLNQNFSVNRDPCYPANGITGVKNDNFNMGKEFLFGDIVEIESCLKNRNRPLSECNGENCNGDNCDLSKFKNKFNTKTCLNYPEESRFINPAYREMSLTEYNMNPYLHYDPQDKIFINSTTSSRLLAKDSFQFAKQTKWDTGGALPKALKIKNDNRCSVCCKN